MKQFALLLLLCCSLSYAVEYGKEGVKEVGGFVGFGTYSHNNEASTRHTEIDITPLFNWFLVDNLYLGPRFHLNSRSTVTTFGFGASVGYAWLPEANIIPFGEGGLEFMYSEYAEKAGLAIPLNGGVKFPVIENVLVGITAGANIKFINSNPGVDFTMGAGITATF